LSGSVPEIVPAAGSAPQAVPFVQSLRFWPKLGFISFGGPAGLVAAAAAVGYVGGRISPHARFSRARLVCALAAGFALWLAALGALVDRSGWDGALAQMAWFFTKAALLTFVGACALAGLARSLAVPVLP
jgi:chromate transporter